MVDFIRELVTLSRLESVRMELLILEPLFSFRSSMIVSFFTSLNRVVAPVEKTSSSWINLDLLLVRAAGLSRLLLVLDLI